MNRINTTIIFVSLLGLNTITHGASTTLNDNGEFHTVIDATAGGAFNTDPHDFTYYNFSTKEVIELTDIQASTSTEWHLAFKRSEIRLNGGVSGPGQVVGLNLTDGQDIIAMETFDDISMSDIPDRDSFLSDGPAYAISEWYSYDSVSHTISASGHTYELRTAEGLPAKFIVDMLEDPGRADAGKISFRWVVGNDLTGPEQSATVDVSGGAEIYFNLSLGEEIVPADLASSTEWDLHFSGYAIRLNGGLSGPGEAGAIPIFQSGVNFEDITKANESGGHYFADRAGSAFSTDSGDWYNYDSTTHLLSSKNHVYVIDTGSALIKMQILNYYREVEGTPMSGFITFRWLPIDGHIATIIRKVGWGHIKNTVDR